MWSQNLCRTCGKISETCHSIHSHDKKIESKIKKCLRLEVGKKTCKDDYKPKQICNVCMNKLNDFSEFIDVSYSTNGKFESIYCNTFCGRSKKVSVKSVSTKDKELKDLYGLIGCGDFNCFQCMSQKQNSYSTDCRKDSKEINMIKYNSKLRESTSHSNLLQTEIIPPPINSTQTLDAVDMIPSTYNASNNGKATRGAKSSPPTVKLYLCPHCGRNFMRRGSLNAHMAVHKNHQDGFTCEGCSQSLVKSELNTHKKAHADRFKCKFCTKKFLTKSKLQRHLRVHTSIINDQKSWITRTVSEKKLIALAQRLHCCPKCCKMFKTKSRLKQHSKIHSNSAVYKCDLCPKTYKYKSNLLTHMKKHDTMCPFCKQTCESTTVLKEHIDRCETKLGANVNPIPVN